MLVTSYLQFGWIGFDQTRKSVIIKHKQSSWIQSSKTVGQTYSDTSPVSELVLYGLPMQFCHWRLSNILLQKGGSPGQVEMGEGLMFQQSWVWILVPYSGWTFLRFFSMKSALAWNLQKHKILTLKFLFRIIKWFIPMEESDILLDLDKSSLFLKIILKLY